MRIAPVAAVAVVATLTLSGCVGYESEVVAGSTVSVGWDQSFYSYNDRTAYGADPANANIVYATNSGFAYYDDTETLVKDESFGTVTKLSDDPLIVRYTVNDGVTWSDGAAVDAADLLLNWAALSGALNDPDLDTSRYVDPATGQFSDDFPTDAVYFDSGADPAHPRGLGLASQLPVVSDDLKSITLRYDRPFADWELAMLTAGLPAHVIGEHALGLTDEQAAKNAVIAAITSDDTADLATISAFWNSGFNFDAMPDDESLLVGDGPYTVTDFEPGDYVTLTANPAYVGKRMPSIETITVRVIPDPLAAVQALSNGSVQVIAPQATEDVAAALKTAGKTVVTSAGGTWEHLDLQFDESKSGVFSDPLVREAFLKTVPRKEIVDDLVGGILNDAQPRDSQVFAPGSPEYASAVESNGSDAYAEVDIDGAKELLAEAGAANPQVCILFQAANPRRVAEFELIQESAALAGFTVTDCSTTDWLDQLGTAGSYDAALYGWLPTNAGVSSTIEAFSTDGRTNLSRYSNDKVDALLADLGATFDPAEQADIGKDVDALLWSDAFGLPLYQYPALYAYDHKAVDGISPSVLPPALFWNVWDWKAVTAG